MGRQEAMNRQIKKCKNAMVASEVSWNTRWFFVSNFFRKAAFNPWGDTKNGRPDYWTPEEIASMEAGSVTQWRKHWGVDVNGNIE